MNNIIPIKNLYFVKNKNGKYIKKLRIVDLFAGSGGFTLAFSKKADIVLANDFWDKSEKIYKHNFPNHTFINDDLNNIDSKNIPDHDILTAGFPCFIAGTKVLTNEGYQNIENISLSHKLMTHTGKFQNILNLQKKIFNGFLYELTIKFHPFKIKCTDEHPFYVRKRINCNKYDNPEWKKASELNEQYYFGMKINKNNIIPQFDIDIDIDMNDLDVWFILGYYIGNGRLENNNICFLIIDNPNTDIIINRISKYLNIINNQKYEYYCQDLIWYNIFEQLGKCDYTKHIPEWIHDAPICYVNEFITGYTIANGHNENIYNVSTLSINLAFGVQRLFLKSGYIYDIVNKDINIYNLYNIKNNKEKHLSFIEDDYVWYAMDKITYNNVNDIPVYNFEVENDNSYIVENIIAHNCQPFSISGKQLGFKDKRANVFYKIIDIIKVKKPRFIILENVKNLESHDKGNTFKTIQNEIKNTGYFMKYKILNTSKITNIPQNRERIYIVCFKFKNDYDKFDMNFKQVTVDNISDHLESNVDKEFYYTNKLKVWNAIKSGVTKDITTNTIYQYRRYYIRENKSNVVPTLTHNMGSGGHNIPLLKDKKGIRKLTPRECFNLQGYPKTYKLDAGLSNSALYGLAGNAITVNVAKKIANKLIKIYYE